MERTCPECARRFTPHNGRQVFCTSAHQRAFWKLQEVRGRLLMPFGLANRGLTHSKDPEQQALARYARNQQDGLLRRWSQEDRAAGRDASLVVATKAADRWSYVDA